MRQSKLRQSGNLLVRRAPWVLLGVSGGVLAVALASEYVFGLLPCALCLYQRWIYVIVIALGLMALLPAPDSPARAVLMAASAITFLGGAIIAGFHVGVEAHWWPGIPACDNVVPLRGDSATDLREALLHAPVVRCDVPQWQLLGLSMAGYNLLISLALAAASAFAAWRILALNRRKVTA